MGRSQPREAEGPLAGLGASWERRSGSRGIEREEKGQLWGFAGPFKECELYSKSDGKPLKGLKSGHGIIRCTG